MGYILTAKEAKAKTDFYLKKKDAFERSVAIYKYAISDKINQQTKLGSYSLEYDLGEVKKDIIKSYNFSPKELDEFYNDVVCDLYDVYTTLGYDVKNIFDQEEHLFIIRWDGTLFGLKKVEVNK